MTVVMRDPTLDWPGPQRTFVSKYFPYLAYRHLIDHINYVRAQSYLRPLNPAEAALLSHAEKCKEHLARFEVKLKQFEATL